MLHELSRWPRSRAYMVHVQCTTYHKSADGIALTTHERADRYFDETLYDVLIEQKETNRTFLQKLITSTLLP